MSVDALRIFAGPSAIPPANQAGFGNTANRRMCILTYIDHAFRDQVLHDVYNDRSRRVAPSYGFDVVVVLHHAWRAWWLELGQHLAILVVLAVALVHWPVDTVIAVSVLTIWYLILGLRNWGGGFAAYYAERSAGFDIRQIRARGKLLGYGLLSAFLVLLAAMVTAFGASARTGKLGETWPERAGLVGAGVVLAVLVIIVAAAAAFRLAWSRQLRTADPQRGRRSGKRMRVIDDQQHHPVTVHSGFKPFIGSGTVVKNWSFAQRLIHGKLISPEADEEYDEPPFTAQNLVDRLKKMISELRDDDHIETRLPGVIVADHIFVEGTRAAPLRDVLSSGPPSGNIEDVITDAIANPGGVARHYLACRVESWGGEVVTSVFVHVSLQGRALSLEFSTCALLPTRTKYAAGTGPGAAVKAIGKGLLSLPEELLGARRAARAPAQLWAALRPGTDQTARASLRIDIGSTVSAREAAAADTDAADDDDDDQSYFQFQDILQHSKIIERRLIATVGDYLKEHGVDTSEFFERAQAILNSGVINTGSGTVNLVGSAVGDQASVTTEAPPPP